MNKTIKNKKITIKSTLYFILIILFQLQGSTQNHTFYSMEDGKFFYNCNESYPLFINYSVRPILDIYGDFHAAPSVYYCSVVPDCSPYWSCGQTNDQWKQEMSDHFEKMESLNFDIVRLLSLVGLHLDPNTGGVTSPESKLRSTGYLKQNDPINLDCYESWPGLEMMNASDFEHQGDLLQEVIDLIKTENFNLKLLVSLGGGGVEILSDYYVDYLEYMANRFRNESVIFGYDLYNEPYYFSELVVEKDEAAEICFNWYDAIKKYAPHHLVTMGVHFTDVFRWDPEILPIDFISFHMYTKRYEWELTNTTPPEPYAYEPSENRYNAFLKWISLSFTKPVIMGETGLSAIDPGHLVPGDPDPHPIIEVEANQKIFAEFALEYTKWYGHIGFTWWKYKDTRWYDPDDIKAIGNYYGLVYNEKYFTSGDEIHKPSGEEFISYVPGDCVDCQEPSVYTNPNSLDHVPIFEEDGQVTDGTNGLPNVLIRGWIENTQNSDLGELSYSITDQNGNYNIYTYMDPNQVIVRKIECSYPSGERKETDWTSISNLPDFILLDIPTSSLPQIPEYTYWTIEDNTIWDDDKVPGPNNVIIEEGATLTIKSSVYFNSGAKLIVERGGTLIIDTDGKLTSNCSNDLWAGVELWGNASLSQTSEEQGLVKLMNGGTIENALIGIKVIKTIVDQGEGELVNYNFTGGKVLANEAVFKNNKIAVKFYDYEFPSNSYFTDCDFIIDDDYIGATNPDYFIKMYSMNGVDVKICRFENNSSNDCYGNGIYSLNSAFKVEGKCLSGINP